MNWTEQFPPSTQPKLVQIAAYVANPLWQDLCIHLEQTYGVAPLVDHSICSGAPGWNVKYRKGSRALCTLYPASGYFTCMVSVGSREAMEAELLLGGCTEYVRKLYWDSNPFNGGRWLMIEVRSSEILEDVKDLIAIRVRKKRP